jgi:hypothetical protein
VPTIKTVHPVRAQLAQVLTQDEQHQAMITKDIILAKLFRAHSANFFRQDKSLRDHGGVARPLMLSLLT